MAKSKPRPTAGFAKQGLTTENLPYNMVIYFTQGEAEGSTPIRWHGIYQTNAGAVEFDVTSIAELPQVISEGGDWK